MKTSVKLTLPALLLAAFCSQASAGEFLRYGGLKGNVQLGQDFSSQNWNSTGSLSSSLSRVPSGTPDQTRIRLRGLDSKWGYSGIGSITTPTQQQNTERPKENISYNFNKLSNGKIQRKFNYQLEAQYEPDPTPTGLVLPAKLQYKF